MHLHTVVCIPTCIHTLVYVNFGGIKLTYMIVWKPTLFICLTAIAGTDVTALIVKYNWLTACEDHVSESVTFLQLLWRKPN